MRNRKIYYKEYNDTHKEKHHEDYSKPLEIKFLCSKCNNPWNEGLGGKN